MNSRRPWKFISHHDTFLGLFIVNTECWCMLRIDFASKFGRLTSHTSIRRIALISIHVGRRLQQQEDVQDWLLRTLSSVKDQDTFSTSYISNLSNYFAAFTPDTSCTTHSALVSTCIRCHHLHCILYRRRNCRHDYNVSTCIREQNTA